MTNVTERTACNNGQSSCRVRDRWVCGYLKLHHRCPEWCFMRGPRGLCVEHAPIGVNGPVSDSCIGVLWRMSARLVAKRTSSQRMVLIEIFSFKSVSSRPFERSIF